MVLNANGKRVGKPSVLPTYADGPLAQPTVVTYHDKETGDIEILTLGGLTKAEALAGQIAGHLIDGFDGPEVVNRVEQVAKASIDIAETILAESARRATARAKEKAALERH